MRAYLLAIAALSNANPVAAQEKPGDVFVIDLSHTSESKSETSKSSSRGGHEYRETVIAIEPDGVVREFDLPADATEDNRLVAWQFPVRVLDGLDGRMTILNREAMIERRDRWLAVAEIPPEACGSWVFTWDAFKIECDPDAIVETLDSLDIQPPSLVEGAMVTHPDALAPAPLVLLSSGDGIAIYRAELTLDPATVRHHWAETDIIVASFDGRTLTREQALAKRESEVPVGTITLDYEADANGVVIRKTAVVDMEITGGEDGMETTRSTVEIERLHLPDD